MYLNLDLLYIIKEYIPLRINRVVGWIYNYKGQEKFPEYKNDTNWPEIFILNPSKKYDFDYWGIERCKEYWPEMVFSTWEEGQEYLDYYVPGFLFIGKENKRYEYRER